MFAFFLEFRVTTRLRPFVISETGLKILVWTQKISDIGNGKRTSHVNRAHVKRPCLFQIR